MTDREYIQERFDRQEAMIRDLKTLISLNRAESQAEHRDVWTRLEKHGDEISTQGKEVVRIKERVGIMSGVFGVIGGAIAAVLARVGFGGH